LFLVPECRPAAVTGGLLPSAGLPLPPVLEGFRFVRRLAFCYSQSSLRQQLSAPQLKRDPLGSGQMTTLPRVLALTLPTLILPTCQEARQGSPKLGTSATRDSLSPARSDEGVHWLVGNQFGIGIESYKTDQVVRLWQSQL